MATTETTVRVKFDGSTKGLDSAAVKGIADIKAMQKSIGDFSASATTASQRLRAAQDSVAKATGNLRVAELKLQELYDSGTKKASTIAAAEERVSNARRSLARATQNASVEARKYQRTLVDDFEKAGDDSGRGLFTNIASWISKLTPIAAEGGTSLMSGMAKAIQSNPYVGAAITAVLLALTAVTLPAIGTLMGGAVVLGFGAGLAGLGLAFAAQNDKVKKEFSDLKNYIVDTLKRISAPLIPVWDAIASDARKAFDKLVPALTASFQKLADPLKRFSDNLFSALSGPQVSRAIDAISTAFGKLLDAIGPQLPGWIGTIADGITRIANSIAANPGGFTGIITFFVDLVGFVLNVIAALTNLYTWLTVTMPAAFVAFGSAVTSAVGAVVSWFQSAWAAVTGWFQSAWSAVSGFFIGIWNGIQAAIAAVIGWFQSAWNGAISWIQGAMSSVGGFISGVWNGVRNAVSGVIGWFQSAWNGAVNAVAGFFSGLAGRVSGAFSNVAGAIRSAINGVIRFVNGAINGVNRVTGLVGIPAIPNIPYLAKGGTAQSGRPYIVGERGPELFIPGRTGRVVNADTTAQAIGGGGAQTINLTLDLGAGIKQAVQIQIDANNRATARAIGMGVGASR